MKAIVITGEQGIGKTELARLISGNKKTIELMNTDSFDERDIDNDLEVIIIDEISSERHWRNFKELSTLKTLTFRPRWSKEVQSIDVSKVLLIGTSISPVDNSEFRNIFTYNLY